MTETTRRTTIVVGAGSSGAVIAARLSEDPAERVVLIEAGPDFAGTDELPASLSDAENPSITGHDWGYRSTFVETPGIRDLGIYPRGRLVGGTSAVNAAIALRGIPEDYDEWAALGNDEWAWSEVLPYFVKLEHDRDFGGVPYHGTTGPVPISRDPVEDWPDALRALASAFADRGFPTVDDHNAPGAAGVGPTPRNTIGAYRASTSVTYLQEARSRPNLEILPSALVVRVFVEGGRAAGVEIERGGERTAVPGDRVVLSGGALNSPQILMLSGIGPKDVIEEAGLDVVVDLPGVGRNLQDHPNIPLIFRLTDLSESRFGFRMHLRYSSGGPDAPPNDIYSTPGYIRTSSMNFATEPDVPAALMVCPSVAKPRGTGWLRITSADPTAPPDVHLNFLADELDYTRLRDAVRLFLDVIGSEPVASHLGAPLVAPGPDVAADDQRLRHWILGHVNTAYHPAGTCRMGPDGDDQAVVDQRLAVRGVQGLYVADASVMPRIPTGFTNIPCYMVGERLADWLREET